MNDQAPMRQALAEATSGDPNTAWEIISAQRETIKRLRIDLEAMSPVVHAAVDWHNADPAAPMGPLCSRLLAAVSTYTSGGAR